MIADPWFYCLAIPALLFTGVSKGGLGAGAGILSVPLMSLAIPPTQAAAIMLPVLLATGYAELPQDSELDLPRLAKPYQQKELATEIINVLRSVRI